MTLFTLTALVPSSDIAEVEIFDREDFRDMAFQAIRAWGGCDRLMISDRMSIEEITAEAVNVWGAERVRVFPR